MNSITQNLRALPEGLVLGSGAHDSADKGMCVMEAVSFVAGEPFSDKPACACPIIGSFMRSWNDSLSNSDRQKLAPYILKLVGTKSTVEVEQIRGLMVMDWYLREFTPTWLDLAGLSNHAETLRKCSQVTSWGDVKAMQSKLNAAESAAYSAAYSAAESAAYSAAESAARSAAEEALAPTATRLQKSAFDLLNRIIAVTSGT